MSKGKKILRKKIDLNDKKFLRQEIRPRPRVKNKLLKEKPFKPRAAGASGAFVQKS